VEPNLHRQTYANGLTAVSKVHVAPNLATYYCQELCHFTFFESRFEVIYTQLPYSKVCLVHALFSKISTVESFLPHILCTPVDMFCFVTGLGCHYSQMHFKLLTQITLARIQFLQ